MKQNAGIAGWVKWAISERKIVYFLILVLVLSGILGLTKMKKAEFPTFVLKQGLVAGIYPGAGVNEVESQLTKPLEEVLMGFKEVDRSSLRSVTKNGVCYIYVDLNCRQSKKDEVWSKIKLALQAEQLSLPAGVLAVAVLDDFSALSTLLIAIESEDKGYTELESYAEELSEKLKRIPELSSVKTYGTQEEEIAVTLDRTRMAAYGIDPSGLVLSYQSASIPLPGGYFDNGSTYEPVHILNPVGSEREVAEKIIYSDPQGNIIRLKDVAKVERRILKPDEFVTYNGNSCLVLSVEMRPDNNIVAFGKEVDKVLEDFSRGLPDSVTMSRITDQPKIVEQSVFSFLRDLLISILVVILVMIVMFPMKSALIASSGVPVCTAVALAVMYFTGMDLNTVTLAALIVVLGMIVDDSIITMDGYMDKLRRGLGRTEAACASAKELFLPTFVATLAICLMFFPMELIITGYLGDFIRLFPWVVSIALMTSLFYAVTVVPSLETRFIASPTASENNIISRAQNSFFRALESFYNKAQGWCFRHPGKTLAAGAGAILLGLLMFSRSNIQMMPMAARNHFVVELEAEGGQGIDRTKELTDSLQSILLQDRRVKSVTSFIGTGAPRFNATYNPILPGKTVSQMIVNTRSIRATEEMLKEYEPRYEHILPGARIRFKQMDYQAVEAPIVITFKGTERDSLLEAADKVRGYMASLDRELKWVHSTSDDSEPSVDIRLDSDEAGRLGINKSLLSLSLAGTFNGQNIATLWEDDRTIPVNLYSEDVGEGMGYDAIGNQMVSTLVPGVSVPLRQIATWEPDWAPVMLERRSGEASVSILADMKYQQSQPKAMKKIKAFIEREVRPGLPEGATISYGGLSEMNGNVGPQILWSFIAAVAVLFIFLLIHFRKTSVAVLTIVMSSLCLFGASFGLWIFHLDFGITAVLGLISLVGIIVRNGIILFDYAEELRFEQGKDVRSAAMEAGQRRMRPIFLTSCTTALGVLPMVISGDLLWQPMGVVISFGTILSIFLIVLIMPVSYWLIFKNAKNEKTQ